MITCIPMLFFWYNSISAYMSVVFFSHSYTFPRNVSLSDLSEMKLPRCLFCKTMLLKQDVKHHCFEEHMKPLWRMLCQENGKTCGAEFQSWARVMVHVKGRTPCTTNIKILTMLNWKRDWSVYRIKACLCHRTLDKEKTRISSFQIVVALLL